MELRQLLSALWRRRKIVLCVFAATFFTIVVGTLLVRPSYDTTAQVLIRRSAPSNSLLSNLGVSAPSAEFSDTDRADYLALATSRPVLDEVIARTNLTRVKVRAVAFRQLPFLKPVFRALGVDVERTEEKMKYDELTSTPLVNYLFPIPHLEVEQVESSNLISFKASSPDPAQAMQIANAAAGAFIDHEVRMIRGDFNKTREFLGANIGRARETYEEAAQLVKTYKENAQTYDIDTETTTLLEKIFGLRASLADTTSALGKTKITIRELEARLAKIPKFQKDSEQLKSNEMIVSLKQSLRDLHLSLAETRTKYTKDHPTAINYENMIAEAKELLRNEMERVFSSASYTVDPTYKDYTSKLASAYIDLATYDYQVSAYQRQLAEYQDAIGEIPEKSSRLSQLDVGFTASGDVYSDLQKYITQVELAEALAVSNVTQVQTALTPDTSDSKHRTPSLLLNTVIALFLASVLGIGAGLLAEYSDDTVWSQGDVESVPGCLLLGTIGRHKKIAPVVAREGSADPLRETFAALRTALRLSLRERPLRTLAVVSAAAGEGKSLVAAHLAAALAREGRKVILIDANLRRPAVHTYFGLPLTGGVASLLSGQAEPDALPQPTGVESLLAVVAGPQPADPLRIADSPKLREFVEGACAAFEFVVIDTPPLLHASEALSVAGWAGNVILVVSGGETPKSEYRQSVSLLTRAGVHVVGVVLNRAHDAAAG